MPSKIVQEIIEGCLVVDTQGKDLQVGDVVRNPISNILDPWATVSSPRDASGIIELGEMGGVKYAPDHIFKKRVPSAG